MLEQGAASWLLHGQPERWDWAGTGLGLQPRGHCRCPQDRAMSWQLWPGLPSGAAFDGTCLQPLHWEDSAILSRRKVKPHYHPGSG